VTKTRCAPFHTEVVFDMATLPSVVDWIVATCRGRFNALAACGHSGLVPASAAAYILGVPLIAVRKEGECPTGDMRTVNAVISDKVQYAFVDDLIGSGNTVERVVEEIAKSDVGRVAEIGGIVLYNSGGVEYTRNRLKNLPSTRHADWITLPVYARLK
jgi:adenine/guanine phosphoribosyltransferase-like PRPP-binding protein